MVEETFTVSGPGEGDLYDHGESFLETTRGSDGHARLEARGSLADSQDYRRLEARLGCPSRADGKRVPELGEQELLLDSSYARTRLTWLFSQFFAQMGIHHFSADMVRASGTPTPNPVLSLPGGNLPALVDWLQRKRKNDWARILDGMRDIIPGLEDIKVDILPSKTLGIFFAEKGFGRPWRIDEVSDGTVHVLSILVALADPRVSAVVIDEPESSLHPWVIKQLGKRLRGLAKRKTVILTTQSPVVVDLLQPSETWVVSRRSGKTSIARLTDLDPRIEEDWRAGDVGLSEFLDAGLVPRAVPGGGDL